MTRKGGSQLSGEHGWTPSRSVGPSLNCVDGSAFCPIFRRHAQRRPPGVACSGVGGVMCVHWFVVSREVFLPFRVAHNRGAMAASLVRRARTLVASGAVRSWASASASRHHQSRPLADRAEFEVVHCGARYLSLSAVAGYREVLVNRFIIPCSTSKVPSPQLLRKESVAFLLPHSVRGLASQSAPLLRRQVQDESKGLSKQAEEDPFDSITDKIPERPVSVAEGASYSLVILAGLAVAGVAAYAVLKELIFEPKEYKIFGKALNRVQNDHQVMVRLGSPITGYGQESRNRAARQRISNRTYVDEDGVERVEVMFYIRGPQGAGKVYSEMFKDKEDNDWKYTYLIVDITAPSATRLMLESYMPAMPVPVRA